MIVNDKLHWDSIYKKNDDGSLGWYENNFNRYQRLISQMSLIESPLTFIAGCGTSLLSETLISLGHQLIINDISSTALNRLKNKLNNKNQVKWFHHDISKPFTLVGDLLDLWFDRAVLHFLLDQDDINQYFKNIKKNVKHGGWVHLEEFSKDGASRCAGLNIHQYSCDELSHCLGDEFTLKHSMNYVYTNPEGSKRPYIIASFKRSSI